MPNSANALPCPSPGPSEDDSDAAARGHARLIDSLRSRLASEAGPEGVRLVQTHISSVLLAGDHAYKIKRPVRLPFLDFSTLARREAACQEELRLNRRTAAALYLNLLPITGDPEMPVPGGTGVPFEWVLRMRRFAAANEWHVMALDGRLGRSHIDALAAHLAGFHAGLAPLAAADLPRKSAWDWTRESLDEIREHPARPASCPLVEVEALRRELGTRFAMLAPVLARRVEEGWLREGHGDLHLGNIVQWQGTPMAFDAIEFDAGLRRMDVAADVAFAFMDLIAHGLPRLAWRLAGAWAESLGDFEGVTLLRAFGAYRAIVRAKVALLSGADSAGFSRYWGVARELSAAPGVPRLLLCSGLSGSGKSTVAAWLAEAIDAVRVRSDVERKRLYGLAPTARDADPAVLYGSEATRRTYARLGELAMILLRGGVSVVVDAASLRQAEREALRTLARDAGAVFSLIVCRAPEAVLRERLARRARQGVDPSDATGAVLDLQLRAWEPWPAQWAPWVHEVHNAGEVEQLEAQVERIVRQGLSAHGTAAADATIGP